jgi:hypothetical protein
MTDQIPLKLTSFGGIGCTHLLHCNLSVHSQAWSCRQQSHFPCGSEGLQESYTGNMRWERLFRRASSVTAYILSVSSFKFSWGLNLGLYTC